MQPTAAWGASHEGAPALERGAFDLFELFVPCFVFNQFRRRMQKYAFEQDFPHVCTNVQCREAMAMLAMLPRVFQMPTLRIWPGALDTDKRRQIASPRVCVFCKRASDDLSHILQCHTLWVRIARIFPPFYAHFDSLELIGILPPPSIRLLAPLWSLYCTRS